MKTKIEIEIERTNKTIAGLVNAMGDKGFEGIVEKFTISGVSQKADEWATLETKEAFEKKLNEQDENFSYKVLAIKKVI